MASFGGFENNFDGFAVPHFAYENYLRSLSHGGAQGMSEAGSITMKFALVDCGAFVVVQKLDGIFNGNDVVIFLSIDAVEQNRERRRLARPGGSSHEDDPVAQLGDFGEVQRQTQRSEVGNRCGNHAHHNCATAALDKDVHAKARHPR